MDALLGHASRLNEEAAGDVVVDDVYERARTEANYTATYFRSMLAHVGPLATARTLLAAPAVSDESPALWERGRLDLTVEAFVLQPQFADLFTDEVLGQGEASPSAVRLQTSKVKSIRRSSWRHKVGARSLWIVSRASARMSQ